MAVKFKPGDKVIRNVDALKNQFIKNKVYTVSYVSDGGFYVGINGVDGNSWASSYFTKIEHKRVIPWL